HGDVVALGAQTRDQSVEGAVLELERDTELLAHGRREVGVDADDLAGAVLELDGCVSDVRTDLDDALVADRLEQFVGQRGGAGLGVAVAGPVVLGLVTAASEKQCACDRDSADRGSPGARGGGTTGGACGHGGSSGGWVECRWGRGRCRQASTTPQVENNTRLRVSRPRVISASCHSD